VVVADGGETAVCADPDPAVGVFGERPGSEAGHALWNSEVSEASVFEAGDPAAVGSDPEAFLVVFEEGADVVVGEAVGREPGLGLLASKVVESLSGADPEAAIACGGEGADFRPEPIALDADLLELAFLEELQSGGGADPDAALGILGEGADAVIGQTMV